jgi:hypothetical protein
LYAGNSFGLGIPIPQRILALHSGKIEAVNAHLGLTVNMKLSISDA